MTQTFAGIRRPSPRATGALIFAGVLLCAPVLFTSAASSQVPGRAPGQAFGYAVGAGLIVSALLLPWLPSLQSALLS